MPLPPRQTNQLRVAILGSGLIGTDLMLKVDRSKKLRCTAFVGRSKFSTGLRAAQKKCIPTSPHGIRYLEQHATDYDLVFDATSAQGHAEHLPVLQALGKIAIDLTPARLGQMCIPTIDSMSYVKQQHINMVTCGGQAAIPIAHAIAETQKHVSYIEAISTVASASAGPATRQNLDEYIHTTEFAIRHYTGIKNCKAGLIFNPATPNIDMRLTIFARLEQPNPAALDQQLNRTLRIMTAQTPGYKLLSRPSFDGDQLRISIQVRSLGGFLPSHAGNLDIINGAAVVAAENFAERVATRCGIDQGMTH